MSSDTALRPPRAPACPPAAASLLTALLLAACGTEAAPLACDASAYAAAVRDAAEPTAADVSTALWPITPANPRLTWTADQAAVRMVTWTGWTGYTLGDNTLSRDVWLSAVPQLQELCRGTPAAQVAARVQQLLGMPPAGAGATGLFVEMWVRPADLFRPCPDAEIDDTGCELAFPPDATPEHRAWMNANYGASYGFWQGTPYPWTALGYTYDWCNPATTVGASEYVVRAGATVTVTAVHPHDAYCLP
jgi:hypothetical protein